MILGALRPAPAADGDCGSFVLSIWRTTNQNIVGVLGKLQAKKTVLVEVGENDIPNRRREAQPAKHVEWLRPAEVPKCC